jgi:hypothetical protein
MSTRKTPDAPTLGLTTYHVDCEIDGYKALGWFSVENARIQAQACADYHGVPVRIIERCGAGVDAPEEHIETIEPRREAAS